MAFVFIVEDGTGLPDANAYADLSYVRDYHESRGQLATWNKAALTKRVDDADATTDALQFDTPTRDFVTGDGPVTFTSSNTLPAPLVEFTHYWLIVVDESHVKLATTQAAALAGTAIDLTSKGSGSHTMAGPDFIAQRASIVRATDYIEQTFGWRFHGVPMSIEQALHWPAEGVWLGDQAIEGVPDLVKRACAEYALRAQSTLYLAPEGSAAVVSESRSQGGISRSVTYAGSSATTAMGRYPVADKWLRPLLRPNLAERA